MPSTADHDRPSPKHDMRPVRDVAVKVPAVTLGFWVVKILATTLGETGGDALSMSMGLGYLTSTAIFAVLFAAAVALQIRERSFNRWAYWFTIIATTMLGTTIADYVDRSLHIGYLGGSLLLLTGLVASLATWRVVTGTVDVASVSSARSEVCYWVTIMFSQTLGTALGDWAADDAGLEYLGAAAVFGASLVLLAALHRWTPVSRVALFWAAFVLTRPLGAVVGDFLDKPADDGGLALSRYIASGVLAAAILVLVATRGRKAATAAH